MNKAEVKQKLEAAEKNYTNLSAFKGKKRQDVIDEYEFWSNKYSFLCQQ